MAPCKCHNRFLLHRGAALEDIIAAQGQIHFFDRVVSYVSFALLFCAAQRSRSRPRPLICPSRSKCRQTNNWKIGLHLAGRWHGLGGGVKPRLQISKENVISSFSGLPRPCRQQQCQEACAVANKLVVIRASSVRLPVTFRIGWPKSCKWQASA